MAPLRTLLTLLFCGLAGVGVDAQDVRELKAKDMGKNRSKRMGGMSREELRNQFGKGKRHGNKAENKKGMDKMKELMRKKRPAGGFGKGGFRERMDHVKNVTNLCSMGNRSCLRDLARDLNMSGFAKADFMRRSGRKQRSDKMRRFRESNKSHDDFMEDMCPQCTSLSGRKKHHCISKCKKEAANDLVQEDIEKCMAESAEIGDCMCTMTDDAANITEKMKMKNTKRTMQKALKAVVCGMFKSCKEEGNSQTVCQDAAQSAIDDAMCIEEDKRHILRGCMMRDMRALSDCEDNEASSCFKESLKSLEDHGFKKRQGKKMLAAQALADAYEAYYDCNCTNETVAGDDCHAQAKEAYKGVKKITGGDSKKFDKYYAKISDKVEYLARVICHGGETTIKMREAIAIEYAPGGTACSASLDDSIMASKVKAEGLGNASGTPDCLVEMGTVYVKAKYSATGKSGDAISKVADNIVSHFSSVANGSNSSRRLSAKYDEVYADQDSEEVSTDATDAPPGSESESTSTTSSSTSKNPEPPTNTGSSGAYHMGVAFVPMGTAILSLALASHVQ